MAVDGPTLVLGLGAFGSEVVARLRPRAGPRTVLLEVEPDATIAPLVDEILGHAERELGLGALVASHAHDDDRRPTLDVMIIADVCEPGVAEAVPGLVSEIGARLLSRFSHIFRGHDLGNLTICPVLGLGKLREKEPPERAKKCLGELEAAAFGKDAPSPSVVPRVFVVEQQTSHYELSKTELVSTVASFLTLLMTTALGEREPMRGFLRGSPEQLRDRRMFASFGCATLELTLSEFCLLRGAADLVESMRTAPPAAAGDAVRADRLVPSADDIAERVRRQESGDLVELLRAHAPRIEFPEISKEATPEQVRDVAYGWSWYDALESTVSATVQQLDEVEMDELVRVADERGQRLRRDLARDARDDIQKVEASGPHGWSQALRLAEQVRDGANREVSRLERALRSHELPKFPQPNLVESAFRGLREEATLRPRPFRLVFFGVLASLLFAALLHWLPKWIVVALFWRSIPILSLEPASAGIAIDGPLHYVLDAPWSFFWVLLLAGGTAWFVLSRYREKRHAALLGTRDSLEAAVRRFLTDQTSPSVFSYYEARLEFVLRAWALRSLRHLAEAGSAEAERLGRISLALAKLGRELSDEAAARSSPATDAEGGDLLFRTRTSPDVLEKTYAAVRPPSDLARALFAKAGRARGDEAPAYLLRENVLATVAPEVELPHEILQKQVGPVVVDFVAELHAKLGVPLEARDLDQRTSPRKYVFLPEWARDVLASSKESMRSLPESVVHEDDDRVHLVAVRTALLRESITLLGGKP